MSQSEAPQAVLPFLPVDVELIYVAEGAANIIYRFSSSSPSKNLLLRLRKALPSGSPNIVTYQYLESTIFPLLPKDLPISYRLVKIPPTLIERLNTALTDLEATGKRPKKRHGLYLTLAEPYGFLITDMTPEEDTDEYLIEFKPKWLTQSPSAPKDWKRCRTCALRLKKAAEASEHISTSPTTIATLPSTTHHKKPSWNGYCPLDLSSSSPDRLRKAVSCILSTSKLSRPGDVDRVTEYLHSQGWLRLLKSKQNQLDTIGPLAITEETASHEFLTCMTLRDCTVFLKISPTTIIARIGDLDLKSASGGKAQYWHDLERELIDEGWYTGDEPPPAPAPSSLSSSSNHGNNLWEWQEEGKEVICQN